TSTRSATTKAAALEAVERNAVIAVGAPSYTSGMYMWKGTAAILKPSDTSSRIIPSTIIWMPGAPGAAAVAMRASCSDPVAPYTSEAPYTKIADENDPSTKYLSAAS